MFGIGGNSNNVLHSVLINIESGSVGVAVVESDKRKKFPHVIFSHRVFVRVSKNAIDQNLLVRQIREAILSASLVLLKDGFEALKERGSRAHIEHIFVTCSAPWGHTVSRNVNYESETPFKITEEFIADLETSAESEVASYISDSKNLDSSDFEIVERSTVDVLINDYQVANPIGLKGTEISLSHIIGVLPNDILKTIYEIRDKLFPRCEIRAHTAMLVTYCVFRDLFPHDDELTLVKITGEATEVGVVKNGLLVDTVCVPYGTNTLVREIMNTKGSTAGEAKALLCAHTGDTLNSETITQVSSYLTTYKESLTHLVVDLVVDKRLPSTMIVVADDVFTPLLKTLVPEAFSKTTNDTYTVLTIDSSVLTDIADNTTDTALILAVRFFHKLHGCGDITTQ